MIADLSTKHYPVTGLFNQPAMSGAGPRYRLSEAQTVFYEEQGFLAGVRLLTDEQVGVLRSELESLVAATGETRRLFYEYNSNESANPEKVLFHALGAWRVTPGFHDLLWNPAFLIPASQLLRGAVRFWHDQIFYKPAHQGGVVGWHQDYSYWTRTQPMSHLSCWIGLDDSTRENGCVHYVPGSHLWNLLPITGLANNMDSIQSVLTEEQKRRFLPVPIELEKGEASFHHPLMVHGSFVNTTDRPRRAAVINVVLDGVASATNEPLLDGVPPIAAGQRLDGQFFPLLFDPAIAE